MTYTEPASVDGRRVDSPEMEELLSTLEQAGFSKQEISEDTFNTSKQRLDELLKKVSQKGVLKDEE